MKKKIKLYQLTYKVNNTPIAIETNQMTGANEQLKCRRAQNAINSMKWTIIKL